MNSPKNTVNQLSLSFSSILHGRKEAQFNYVTCPGARQK